jgi:prolyl 4-hydroxylase
MQTDTQAKEFDPNNDPAKLARIGAHVTKRLNANPLVQKVEHEDAQLYVYQGFLSAKDCKTLIAKIDADAVPSTLYKGTDQQGFRTSYSCHLNRWDAFIAKVEARMSDVLGIDNNYAETMQGQRYQIGQEFKAHHDFFTQAKAIGSRKAREAGSAVGPP